MQTESLVILKCRFFLLFAVKVFADAITAMRMFDKARQSGVRIPGGKNDVKNSKSLDQ